MNWSAPKRPIEHVEETLISAILQGDFAPGDTLPAERELAGMLGVTRPTLREGLRRLERDGWLLIQQGKPTLVTDFWREGGLNVLTGIMRYSQHLPDDFVLNLLRVRLDMAPSYTREAVRHSAPAAAALLAEAARLPDDPAAFAAYDWRVQHRLTVLSGNPIYALILNGFAGVYETLARQYFAPEEARSVSRVYYADLHTAALAADAAGAEAVTRQVMARSVQLWMAREQAAASEPVVERGGAA
ncbi:MAG: fatty acid metabolism transcriptional regulator FadR [Anaerolineae bacterium]|nr:fatty acid metabolism transcriptional regulator FadR [Anaerolineae bacterium]